MSHFVSEINGVSFYAPEKTYTNDDLSKMMNTSDQWITERTGIKERRIAPLDLGTADLGTLAAKQVLEKTGYMPSDIDVIVAATLSPDYYFPGIGVLIQQKLEAPHVPAFDIRAQCSGFVYSLAAADSFLKSGLYKRALIVCSEIHSRVIEFSDRGRNVSVLFGDGAGAAILEAKDVSDRPTANGSTRGIIDHVLGSDGSGAEILAIKRPGMGKNQEHFITEDETKEKAFLPIMEGRQVFKNAVTRMLEAAAKILERNHITPDDIDLVVPHQANIRINETVRQKLGVPTSKVFNNIHKYGNTTAATIPICLSEAEAEGRLKKGDLVLTLAFGSGFTWGANLLRW